MAGTKSRIGQRYGSRRALKNLLGKQGYVPIKTGRRQGIGVEGTPYGDPPVTWKGSLPEWAIYWAHLAIGRKPDEDFQYQYGLDVGAILDFYEFGEQLGINVQGIFWHYLFNAAKRFSDQEQQIRIEAVGIQLIFIDEDDALRDPIYYLKEALAGRDHSRVGRGVV